MPVFAVQGIRETVHPYSFVARVGFQELLAASDANSKTVQLLPKLVPPLRAAMVSFSFEDLFLLLVLACCIFITNCGKLQQDQRCLSKYAKHRDRNCYQQL